MTACVTTQSVPLTLKVHRVLNVMAALSLLQGLRQVWNVTVPEYPIFAGLVVVSLPLLIILAIVGVVGSRPHVWLATDGCLLLLGAILLTAQARARVGFGHPIFGVDVGMVVQSGAAELLRTGHLYGISWPLAHQEFAAGSTAIASTMLLDGHAVTDYGYPPMAAVLAAAISRLTGAAASAVIASTLGLIATAGLLFLLLPRPLRLASVVICFGLDRLPEFALAAYPALVALPFVVITVAGWQLVGLSGRLSRRDILGAACLGLACAGHQLAWFLAPFLLVGIWLNRRGDGTAASASRLTLQYAGVSALIFIVMNAWFILQNPKAWLDGILGPVTQASVPHGQGLVTLIAFSRNGSGNLSWLSVAPLLLAGGLLIISALNIRALAPVLTVMPWLLFVVSLRSQDGYYLLMAPAWLVGAAAAGSRGPYREPHLAFPSLQGTTRVLAAAALPIAALGCVAAASFTEPPLSMTNATYESNYVGKVWRIRVSVTNSSPQSLRPLFALTPDHSTTADFWNRIEGPPTLAANATADYVLVAPNIGVDPPTASKVLTLRAFTREPKTIANARLVGPDHEAPMERRAVLMSPLLDSHLRPGRPAIITVQLRDGENNDVKKAGVPIELRTKKVESGAAASSDLFVNGQQVPAFGRVLGHTDAAGRVAFAVTSTTQRNRPVILDAVPVNGGRSVGYLSVLWR